MGEDKQIIDWLLQGDPSIKWQAQRDLLYQGVDLYNETRREIVNSGWGARLLELQDGDGTWGGGLYGPKWVSTTYTLLLLRRLGLAHNNKMAQKACLILLNNGFLADAGINFSSQQIRSETCITGMVLSLLAYFRIDDSRVHLIAKHLIDHQMMDQGWNCRAYQGAVHSSFHTTISALEGLREYEKAFPHKSEGVVRAQAEGREFLLIHQLYRSDRTGEIVKPAMTRLPFPPRWYYDFLRALDYFQESGAERDDRLADPISLLLSKRKKDGTWNLNRGPSGVTHFEIEKAGKPSRWNTLRAMRVLQWWRG